METRAPLYSNFCGACSITKTFREPRSDAHVTGQR
jgi:hypothetical protein